MNDDLLADDPVLANIRAEAERMLADTTFRPGPPKKKAHKVAALAPTIRALRAQGRTWPFIAQLCKAKGLAVTAKTLRVVMRELDTERNQEIGAAARTTSSATHQKTPAKQKRRKHRVPSNGKAARKLAEPTADGATDGLITTPRSARRTASRNASEHTATPETDSAATTTRHANGNAHVLSEGIREATHPVASEEARREHRSPTQPAEATHVPRSDSVVEPAHPIAASREAAPLTTAPPKSKRRYGAKGIEY